MGNNLLGSLVSGVATGLGTAAKMGEQKANYELELKKQRLKQQMADNNEFDNAYKYHKALADSGDPASLRVVQAMDAMRNDPNRSAPPKEFYQHIYKILEQSNKDKEATMPFIDMLNKLVPQSMQGSPLLPQIANAEGIQTGAQLQTPTAQQDASNKLVDYSQFFQNQPQPMVQGGGMSLNPDLVAQVQQRRVAAEMAKAKLKGQAEAMASQTKDQILGVPSAAQKEKTQAEKDDATKINTIGSQAFNTQLGRKKSQLSKIDAQLKDEPSDELKKSLAGIDNTDWASLHAQRDQLAQEIDSMVTNQLDIKNQLGKQGLEKYRSKTAPMTTTTAKPTSKYGPPPADWPGTIGEWQDYQERKAKAKK